MTQMREQLARAGAVALAVVLLAGSCQLIDSGNPLSEAGVVEFLEIEGGCWVLQTEQDTYEPLNLPEDLREDGLQVRFQAEVLQNVATICQVGPVIEIQEIERTG